MDIAARTAAVRIRRTQVLYRTHHLFRRRQHRAVEHCRQTGSYPNNPVSRQSQNLAMYTLPHNIAAVRTRRSLAEKHSRGQNHTNPHNHHNLNHAAHYYIYWDNYPLNQERRPRQNQNRLSGQSPVAVVRQLQHNSGQKDYHRIPVMQYAGII
jgi:hypothetical protein